MGEVKEEKTVDPDELIRELASQGLPTKKIASEVAAATGLSKKEMYERALHLLQ